jgi:uncharacterized protein YqjF (DUF2071 family)
MELPEQILTHTSNRVYPIPKKDWKYYQEWHDTVFFHWKVSPALLKKHIPEGTELDTIDGNAWVSLVAFDVKKMRMRNWPSIPYLNNFHEINVRTYVSKDGIPGIYMFSIETDKLIEVLISRLLIGIPYQKADIERDKHSLWLCNSKRKQHVSFYFKCRGASIKKTKIDVWLTERHCLYEFNNNTLCRIDIHHKEWDLKKPSANIHLIKYRAGDFPLNIFPDTCHCCKKIKVLLWGKENIML